MRMGKPRGGVRGPVLLTLLLSALSVAVVRPAGEGPLRLDLGSPWAGAFLEGWSRPMHVELDAPAALDGRTRFVCRRAPTHGGLSLPVMPGGPFRLVFRASTNVRSALVVQVSHEHAGEVLVQPGVWDRYAVTVKRRGNVPAPVQIGLTLRPLPLSRGTHGQEPELWVEFVEVESAAGFTRSFGHCLIAASLPLAALALALILGLPLRWCLTAAAATVLVALLLVRSTPLGMFAILPWAIGVALSMGAVTRALLRPPGWMVERARTLLEPGDDEIESLRPRSLPYKVGYLTLGALAAALPALIVCWLVAARFGTTLFDFTPASINDEIHYWLEILAFSKVGFAGGYSVVNERPAPASFSHFGSHGPLFPILYGAIGRLFGWRPYSAPFVHLVLVALGVCSFILFLRPRIPRLLLLGFCMATFWPLLLFLPTNMREGLHFAAALVLAGAFHALLTAAEAGRSGLFRTFSLGFLVLMSLMRPSWSSLLVPFFMLSSASLCRRQALLSVVKAVGLIWVLLAVFRYLAAPYPGGFRFLHMSGADTSLRAFVTYAKVNILRFSWGADVEHLLRVQCLIVIVVLVILVLKVRPPEPTTPQRRLWQVEALFHLYNLGATALATVLVYFVGIWHDYRVLGTHLLLSLALLSISRRPLWNHLALALALSNLAFAPAFVTAFDQRVGGHFGHDRHRIAAFAEAIRDRVVYRGEESPWCNTMLATYYPFWFDEMVALPAGIGVTALFGADQLSFPAKSAYVLFEPERYERNGWGRVPVAVEPAGPRRVSLAFEGRGRLRLEHLAATPIGDVYWNLDSGCRSGPVTLSR